MKIVVFNVGNAACSLAVCPNGHSMMIDCGCHSDNCPIDGIKRLRANNGWLSIMRDYITTGGNSYPLTMLAVTHPDEDHIRNIEKLHHDFTPFLIHRRYIETFPITIATKADATFSYYRENVCKKYRGSSTDRPIWGFKWKCFHIPMSALQNQRIFPYSSIMNNSSYVYLLEYSGFRILFGGDMEQIGWDWLLINNKDFLTEIVKGVDFFVVSHHGHKSGYSPLLAGVMPKPKLCILSKASESGEETDVCSSYSALSTGHNVESLATSTSKTLKSLTTRNNGNIYIDVGFYRTPFVYVSNF